uniref:EB domain-containing protein n=1 Tax=Romanomermis culicivorax TaxID=13658 RepID=A0A915JC99_ROMCU
MYALLQITVRKFNELKQRPQCPTYWERQSHLSPYMKCLGSDDYETCAPGYSCLPSDVSNVHICCQLKEVAFCSLTGKKPLLKGRSQPWTCENSAQCPSGASCQISKDYSSKFCCEEYSSSSSFDSIIPCSNPLKVNGRIFYCDQRDVCPENFFCDKSTMVCCPQLREDSSKGGVCDNGQLPLLIDGRAVECRFDHHRCRTGYHCQQNSRRKGKFYCCQKPECPNEDRPLFSANGQPKYCNPSFSFSCPSGSMCRESVNMPGNFVCCIHDFGPLSAINRCIGRMTHMNFGFPIDCSSGESHLCPRETEN